MDYKFWILLLLCIVLFYMYHQIEDLKSEIHHLHNKTDNIAELEKYVDKHKKLEITQNLNNAINEILPQNEKKENEITLNNKETSINSVESVKSESNSESSKYEYSDSDNQYNVDVDDVMEIIEQNHINELQTDMNNKFKIKEIIEYNNSSDEEFIKSNDSVDSSNLVNKVELKLENKEHENEDEDEDEDENEDEDEDKDENEDELEMEKIVDNENKKNELNYDNLMTLTVTELKELAKENNIDLKKQVEGKRKNKVKKELCQELAARN